MTLRKHIQSTGCFNLLRIFSKGTGVGTFPCLEKVEAGIRLWIYHVDPAIYKLNGIVLKQGKFHPTGIICNCCKQMFSVSTFEKHTGSRMNRPSEHIHLKDGRSLRNLFDTEDGDDPNDDICAVCSLEGQLVCCDTCPASFHLGCIGLKEVPPGDWYCNACLCSICSRGSGTNTCAQCRLKYHARCVGLENVDPEGANWFCGNACKEIFTGLQNAMGVKNELQNGLSWIVTKFQGEDKRTRGKLAMAKTILKSSKAISNLSDMDNVIDAALCNHGPSPKCRMDFRNFYTVCLENTKDQVVSVAVMRIHGSYAAEIPYISASQRRGSCILLAALEKFLYDLKVELLVLLSPLPKDVLDFEPVEGWVHQDLVQLGVMAESNTVLLAKELFREATSTS